jgi:hypothetical protein
VIEIALSIAICAVVLVLLALIVRAAIGRRLARVGRVAPESINEIVAAERALQPGHSIRGGQLRP